MNSWSFTISKINQDRAQKERDTTIGTEDTNSSGGFVPSPAVSSDKIICCVKLGGLSNDGLESPILFIVWAAVGASYMHDGRSQ